MGQQIEVSVVNKSASTRNVKTGGILPFENVKGGISVSGEKIKPQR